MFKDRAEMKNKSCIKNVLLVDLEGSITDFSHRIKYARDNKEKFDKEFVNDKCDNEIVGLSNSFYNNSLNIRIIIISSRREVFRKESEDWLRKNNVIYDELIMQRDKDKRTSFQYKMNYINENKNKIFLAIEDNKEIYEYIKSKLIPVFKVKCH